MIQQTNLIHIPVVRLEPILIELEREQEDLFIIGHASVIRCLLAYLIGLPASEIPAIEIARGDLLEVVPASYGVHSRAFHFWDGPGRRGDGGDNDVRDANNFYENYAESTKGKRRIEDFDGHFGATDQLLKEVKNASTTTTTTSNGEMKAGK
jgi:6-phosphofructo-2-kinase/fructose-2,6-biphosphatase 4